MANNHGGDVIVISDSEDEVVVKSTQISPLTVLKPKLGKQSSVKHKIKRLNGRQLKTQTKLDSFFQTITIKNDKADKSSKLIKSGEKVTSKKPTCQVTKLDYSKSVQRAESTQPTKATKRAAVKGSSPRMKVANKERSKITELKGMCKRIL